MKTIKLFSLAMLCVAAMTSCTSRESKIQTLVNEHFSQTLDEPTSLKIESVSQPDSAFGLRYFTPKEKGIIFKSVKDATECLMERTNDAYAMTIADMEMQVSANLYGNLLGEAPKGAFSGWKVRTSYTAKSKYGCYYKAQRWFFIDKDCKSVIKYFDLPIVGSQSSKKVTSNSKKQKGSTNQK